MKIALIEDSKKIGYIVFKAFQKESITVEIFESLKATERIRPNQFAGYVVDYNLGDGSGTEFVKKVRDRGEKTPILMLTVRSDLEDKLECFKLGADDYLTKPFELAELIARIKILINRSYDNPENIISIDNFNVDLDNNKVSYKSKSIRLSRMEYQIMEYLVRNRGRIIDKDRLVDSLWIDSDHKDPNIVNVYVNRIRDKLKKAKAPNIIKTVRGFGYTIE